MEKCIQTTQAFRQDLSVFGPVFNYSDFTLKKQTDDYYGNANSLFTLTLTKLSGILLDTGYFHVTPDTYIVYATVSPYFQYIF